MVIYCTKIPFEMFLNPLGQISKFNSKRLEIRETPPNVINVLSHIVRQLGTGKGLPTVSKSLGTFVGTHLY